MKIEHTLDDGTVIVYNEDAFSGKKTITFGDEQLVALSRKQFQKSDGTKIDVKGKFISGVTLLVQGSSPIVLAQNKWYEWILIMLPMSYVGVGIFFGAIGGGLSGAGAVLAAYANANILRSKNLSFGLRILYAFGLFLAGALIAGGLFWLLV